jgi:hypothetical protein
MITGEIVAWNQEVGCGLVESPDSVPKDIEPIVDESVVDRPLDLQVGDVIEYQLGKGSQGWIVSEIISIERKK